MNYNEMSDFEINKAVAIALGHKCYYDNDSFTNGLMGSSVVVKGNGTIGSINFVNSWADAGPIIQKYGIELSYDGISWSAGNNLRNIGWYNDWKNHPESPCRVAMIVFLMMRESNNG